MRLCHSKCTNSKWEALCNLREQSDVVEFKHNALEHLPLDDTKRKTAN